MTNGPVEPAAVLRALRDLAATVGPALAPPGHHDALQAVVDTARQAFGAQACSIALLDEDEQTLEFMVASGAGAADVVGMRVPVGVGVAGWVVSSGQAVEVSDVTQDPRFARELAAQTGYLPRSILAAPLETEQSMLGVVEVLDRDADRPGADRDPLVLALFAQQSALAIESARLFTDSGRMLLDALVAAGATGGADVGPAARWASEAVASALDDMATQRPPTVDPDLAELSALLVRLTERGPAERRLAVRLVSDVLDFHDSRPAP